MNIPSIPGGVPDLGAIPAEEIGDIDQAVARLAFFMSGIVQHLVTEQPVPAELGAFLIAEMTAIGQRFGPIDPQHAYEGEEPPT